MPTDRRTRRIGRRGLFEVWVGLTIAFAAALASALPFMQGERFAFLAGVPVVALNLILLAAALGRLIWHVFVAAPEEAPGRAASGPRTGRGATPAIEPHRLRFTISHRIG